MFSADIVLVNCKRKQEKSKVKLRFRTQKDKETYDQIRRTLGQEVVRRVHRLGHAVVREISLAHEIKRDNLK